MCRFSIALAISLSVLIFALDKPTRRSLSLRARSTDVWSNGSAIAARRP
jgi:hypothetical protein